MTQQDQANTPQDNQPAAESAAPEHQPQPQAAEGVDVTALQAALAEAQDKMMRALAEAENTRRRAVKEREDAAKFAVSGFARDLLDFADNFHRALAAIPPDLQDDPRVKPVIEGLTAMEASLLQSFGRHGIEKIEPLDQPFNPNFHEVMFEAPIPGKAAGTVIQVIDAGYVLNGRLLRAAKVGIAKAEDGQSGGHQIDQQA